MPAQTTADSTMIRTILDSVSISRIYQTVEHLSGEEPYRLDGRWDSIMTRYSNSPQIYKAQYYIQDRLEKLGYTVDVFPFKGTIDYHDIKFAPNQSKLGWLSGSNGKIYKTLDGGQTWKGQYTSEHSVFQSIYAFDDRTIWAVGSNGAILKSDDGVNWIPQYSPTENYLFDVYFHDANLGWICGVNGILLSTSNGGTVWEIRNTPTTHHLNDIYFINENEGWAAGDNGTMIHTSNGGITWLMQNSGTNSHLHGVHFLSLSKGFAIGAFGTLLKTTNGGLDWTLLMESNTGDYFYDIDFVDQNNGIIVGITGSSLKTTDGGNTWLDAGKIQMWWVNGIDMLDANTVWASGSKMLAFSNDKGTNWLSIQANTQEEYLNIVYATKTGVLYPDDYYILCAHYDATSEFYLVRAPGADDNASGTAAVIEAAKVLAEYSFPYSIRLMLFAGEEQGKVGSAVFARHSNYNEEKIHGVINLDMIGYDGNNDGTMGIHAGLGEGSQHLGNFLKANIYAWGLPLDPEIFTNESSRGSDHDSFWSFGYPAIMLIEDLSDKNPFYHSLQDRLSALRQTYFHAMARLAIGSIATLANNDEYIPPFLPDPLLGGIISSKVKDHGIFQMHPLYPNPFNTTVNISYYLPYSANVTISIFTLLGEQIEQLISSYQEAGEHSMMWQPVNAPGGIYCLRIQAGEQIETERLILIR